MYYLYCDSEGINKIFDSSSEEPKSIRFRTSIYKTLEDLKKNEVIMEENCIECGGYITEVYTERTLPYCFICDFWGSVISRSDNIVINGNCYNACKEDSKSFRGFDGREFRIKFFDGKELCTTNLWSRGKIPLRFRDRLPDNAYFI